MYHPFFQFVLPRIGQAALDVLLYVNFLQLPPLQLVSAWPVLYYGLPLLLMLLLAYISRDPLGLGIVFTGHLVTFTASVPASRCSCAGWVVRRNSFGAFSGWMA